MFGSPVQSKPSAQGIFMSKYKGVFNMIDISLNNLNKYYGSNHVLKGISFEINSGEKVGLLGKNGSGKTTLFKTITGNEYYESGTISKASGKRIEMLAQIPVFGENETSEEILRSSFAEINDVFSAMKDIEGELDPQTLKRYGRLMEDYERLGGYDMEFRIDKICNGMNIDTRLRKSLFNQLSGGEKSRVNLARILLHECDILLLDEPTNHLDLASLEWLEKFLHDFTGTVIVVSHDRVFLDNVVDRIIEIDNGEANFYTGNYSFYLEERERRFLSKAEQYKQQQHKINQLEAAIHRQRVWAAINPANTGLAKRAIAMEKRIEKMDKVEKPLSERKLTAQFDSCSYAAKEMVAFIALFKSYSEKILFQDVNLKIRKNDRIALVGDNGCGKTTLMKIIIGDGKIDNGEMKISSNTKCGYMPQIITFNDENATILDILRFEIGVTEEKARSILAKFKFMATDVYKIVANLSGGEKSRLKLCLLMQKNINFLLLDEPTNHLDIASREWIENALSEFEGTILFVSHDRYFLRKFADKIWSMENGSVINYDCDFDEYLDIKRKQNEPAIKKEKIIKATANCLTKTVKERQTTVSIEEGIEKTEAELKSLETEIETDISNGNFSRMNELHDRKSQLLEKINSLYDDWACGESDE